MALFVAKSGSLQTIKEVYECKNMLREGVDYVKGDWLSYNVDYNTASGIRFGIDITFPYLTNKIDYNLRNLRRWGNSHFVGFINSGGYKCVLYTNNHGSNTIDVFQYEPTKKVISNPFGVKFKLQDTNFHVENGVCSLFDQSFNFPYQMYRYDLANSVEGWNHIGEISAINCGEFAYYPCQLLTNIEQRFVGYGEHYAQGDCGFIGTDGKFYGYTGNCTLSIVND